MSFVFWLFEFVSKFACLREAAPAKAGISCFKFEIPIPPFQLFSSIHPIYSTLREGLIDRS